MWETSQTILIVIGVIACGVVVVAVVAGVSDTAHRRTVRNVLMDEAIRDIKRRLNNVESFVSVFTKAAREHEQDSDHSN